MVKGGGGWEGARGETGARGGGVGGTAEMGVLGGRVAWVGERVG